MIPEPYPRVTFHLRWGKSASTMSAAGTRKARGGCTHQNGVSQVYTAQHSKLSKLRMQLRPPTTHSRANTTCEPVKPDDVHEVLPNFSRTPQTCQHPCCRHTRTEKNPSQKPPSGDTKNHTEGPHSDDERSRTDIGNRKSNKLIPQYVPNPHRDYAGEHSYQGDGPPYPPHTRNHANPDPRTRTSIGEIINRMSKAHADDDWWRDILSENMHDEPAEPREAQFWGDDMKNRSASTGCRLSIANAQKKTRTAVDEKTKGKVQTTVTYISELLDDMKKNHIDILIVAEIGVPEADPFWTIMDYEASSRGLSMERAASLTKAAGLATFMTKDWHRRMVGQPTVFRHKGEARAIHLNFQAKQRKPVVITENTEEENRVTERSRNPLERLHLVGVYGYNNATTTNKMASNALWENVQSEITKERRNKWVNVIVAGDLNATSSTQLDTDEKDAEADDDEPDAPIILSATTNLGLIDVLRNRHPNIKAWSRESSGENSDQKKRRLDMYLTDQQIAKHAHTRTGIFRQSEIESDHKPVWLDIPLDCALRSSEPVPMWSSTKTRKRKMMKPQKTEITAANETLRCDKKWTTKEDEANGWRKMKQLQNAMEKEGVVEVKEEVYPKPVTKFKGFSSTHYIIRTWRKRLKKAASKMAEHGAPEDPLRSMNRFSKVKQALALTKIPKEVMCDEYKHLIVESDMLKMIQPEQIENAPILVSRRQAEEAILCQAKHVTAALNKVLAKETKKRITEKLKAREQAMEEGDTKTVIRSIFHAFQKRESLEWARRPDGSLAETESELGNLASDKFKDWFASVVPVESRWAPGGTQEEGWKRMMNMDTSKMSDEAWNVGGQNDPQMMSFPKMVEEIYEKPNLTQRAIEEEWWEGIVDTPNTVTELKVALQHAQNGTAPGESQLHIGELKLLDDDNLEIVCSIFEVFRKTRRIPDELNCALLRLLPKTAAGLSDLDKTRPITLIETLTKLYERVIIMRVTERLMRHGVLEPSQYGAVPKAGTLPPRRVLAAVFEDANMSEKEMHLLLLDLKKAFDTCEYWSQALSWRALGAPEDLIKILLNLDAGSNSPADPHPGPGATTRVILANGKFSPPFPHGRGVRQGSVGGPIKWVVFMHFWLLWVKRTMSGKGYKMTNQHTNISAEALAQMFVDDSCWLSGKATNAQRLARMCELFCKFHGIMLNKEKCECISMNAEGSQVRWIPSETHKIGIPFEQKGKNGTVKQKTDDGRWAKYLGVFYEARMKWQMQRQFLTSKLTKLLTPLQNKKMSLDMAVQMVNIKVVPAIMDGLQVAAISTQAIQTWDRQIVKVIRSAGAVPLATPPEVFFLPRDLGGMGLTSLWDRTSKSRIGNECLALNDVSFTPEGEEKVSTLAQVARVMQKHEDVANTWANAVKQDLERLNMEMVLTRNNISTQARRDAEKAKNAHSVGTVEIYTDGGTEDMAKKEPKTGWGWSRYSTPDTFGMWDHLDGGHNRLAGEQSNDLGEAMAVLQALRNTHLEDKATLYIDNMGVVLTAQKQRATDPRQRMKQGGRAIWNRIEMLIAARNAAGAGTEFKWIHSHVDEPERRKWQESWPMECACGGQGKRECDPKHRHHQGNADADERATKGIAMAPPRESELHPTCGEEKYHLKWGDTPIQGNIYDALTEAVTKARVVELATRAQTQNLTKAQDWVNQLDLTDEAVRKHVSRTKTINNRFRVRAWSQTLCVYAEEAKKVGGTKGAVYTDKLEGGRCRCCDETPLEDLQHFLTCPEREDLWITTMTKIERMWTTQKGTHPEWKEMKNEWRKDTAGSKWNRSWRRLGMVPAATTARVLSEYSEKEANWIIKMQKKSATKMLETAHKAWTARNEMTQKWEKANGITKEKAKMGRKRWKMPPTAGEGRKGPKRKPDEDVAPSYASLRRKKEKAKEMSEKKGPVLADAYMRVWQKDEKTKGKQATAVRQAPWASVGPWLQSKVRQTFTHKTGQEEQKDTSTPAQKPPNRCSVSTCNNAATTTGTTCKRNDPRCRDHSQVRCIGALTVCRCEVEDTENQNVTMGATRTIKIGDTIRLRSNAGGSERWIEGTVVDREMERRAHRERWGNENAVYTIDPTEHTRLRHLVTITSRQLMTGGWWLVNTAQRPPNETETETEKPPKIPTADVVHRSGKNDESNGVEIKDTERGEQGPTQIRSQGENEQAEKRDREKGTSEESASLPGESGAGEENDSGENPRNVRQKCQDGSSKNNRSGTQHCHDGTMGECGDEEPHRTSRRQTARKRSAAKIYDPSNDGKNDESLRKEAQRARKRQQAGTRISPAAAAQVMATVWMITITSDEENDPTHAEWEQAQPGKKRKSQTRHADIDALAEHTSRKRQRSIAGYYKLQGRGVG